MARTITPKQKKFAKVYIETGNGSLAVKEAGYAVSTDESARAIASQNLLKPRVREYLESRADRAAERVVELSEQQENLPVSLGASKDILDRAGYGAVAKSQSVHVNINTTSDEKTLLLTKEYEEKLKQTL